MYSAQQRKSGRYAYAQAASQASDRGADREMLIERAWESRNRDDFPRGSKTFKSVRGEIMKFDAFDAV